MPQRFLRPGITTSERFNALSWESQSLYVRLITLVDDFGRYEANLRLLVSHTFPLGGPDGKSMSTTLIAKWCKELSDRGLVQFYEIDQKKYLQMLRWTERARAEKSKFPAFDSTCEQLTTLDIKCSPPSSSPSPPSIDLEVAEIPVELMDSNFPATWTDYLQYRKERKLPPLANIGIKKTFTKLSRWGPKKAILALENTMSNNWQGIFEPKNDVSSKPEFKL